MDYLQEAKNTYGITTDPQEAWTTFSADSLNAAWKSTHPLYEGDVVLEDDE